MVIGLFAAFVLVSPFTRADEVVPIPKPAFRSVRFVDVSHGWIAGHRGLFYTSDGGKTWARQAVALVQKSESESIAQSFYTGQIVWAAGESILLRSHDGLVFGRPNSAEWSTVAIPKHILVYLQPAAFIDPQTGWGGGSLGTVFRTSDGGKNWEQIAAPADDVLQGVFAVSANEVWIAGDGGVLLHSVDSGRSWSKQILPAYSSDDSIGDIHAIHFVGSQTGWACAVPGYIFHTVDGGQHWKPQASPYVRRTSLNAISFADRREGWIVGGRDAGNDGEEKYEGVILHTSDGGQHWEVQKNKAGGLLDVQALPNGRAWAVGGDGSVLRTFDHGKNWKKVKVEVN